MTGGKITVTKNSGKEEFDITEDMVKGYDPMKLGEQTLTITYGGIQKTYKVNVNDYITGITIQKPNKTEYKYGEELNLEGATYVENYKSGATSEAKNIIASMISGYNKNKLGNQTVTVTVGEFKATFEVNVTDEIKSVVINVPSKTVYNHGDKLDLAGAKIVEEYQSGETKDIEVTEDMFTEEDGSTSVNMSPNNYDSTNKLEKTLKLNYKGESAEYKITIINDVKSIQMHTTPKTDYNVNENLDITGG